MALSLPSRCLQRCFTTNNTGQRINTFKLQEIVNTFPPVLYAFGYGSGVFSQEDNLEGTMVDVVMVVNDAVEWHSRNLQQHSHHYALLPRLGGATLCASIQRIPPGVYFHAGIEMEQNVLLKYGVVELNAFKQDLCEWKYLYLAGRLHKPTVCIVEHDEVTDLQHQHNLPAALATSLLLLNDNNHDTLQRHSLSTIYQQIASLSYAGDLRVSVGAEDPRKIEKLVHSDGQLERWNDLYRDCLRDLEKNSVVSILDGEHVEYDVKESRDEFIRKLPVSLQQYHDTLQQALSNIVAPAARNQTIKGVVTAGIVKSTQYAFNKLSKGILKR